MMEVGVIPLKHLRKYKRVKPMNSTNVKIIKKPDDPICPRVSMGGNKLFGYYIVYRGNLLDIKEMFDQCYKAIQIQTKEADYGK